LFRVNCNIYYKIRTGKRQADIRREKCFEVDGKVMVKIMLDNKKTMCYHYKNRFKPVMRE